MAVFVPGPARVASADIAGIQTATDITSLASGGYVVTWVDRADPEADAGVVRARAYDASGLPTSGEITVGAGLDGSVAALPDGGFAVAYRAADAVDLRLFDPSGRPRTDAIPLDSRNGAGPAPVNLGRPMIATLADGRIAVAWPRDDDYLSTSTHRVVATIVGADGTGAGNRIQVGATTLDNQRVTSLAITPTADGGFALARFVTSGAYSVFLSGRTELQFFDAAGAARTDALVLSDGVGTLVSAALLADGRVAVGYITNQSSVFRVAAPDGTVGPERVLGPAAYSSGYRAPTDIVGLEAGPGGNLLATYAVQTGSVGNIYPIYQNRTALLTPEGSDLGTVLPPGAGSLVAALPQGGVAVAQAVGQSDVFTRVYQAAAPTRDPDGTPLVNDAFYAARYPDVAAAGIDPDDHYARYGWREGRNPNALFDTEGYRAANPDVAAAGIDPLDHYDRFGWREGRDPSAAFDTESYLARNPDVAAAGLDPLAHYLQYGQAEGREITPAIGNPVAFVHGSFDAAYYLLSNPDVGRAARGSGRDAAAYAYEHFESYGWREGRNPNAYFDVRAYLTAYGDVQAAGIDPLGHYDQYGWREGRDPSGLFDTTNYLSANADVRAAGIDPLTHFLTAGAREGRAPLGDGVVG